MPAWSQANGGPLTEDEIDDITAYILTWESAQAIEPSPTPEPSPGFLGGWPLVVILVVVFVALLIMMVRG